MTPGPATLIIRAVLWDVYGTLVLAPAALPLEAPRPGGVEGVRKALEWAGVALADGAAAERMERRFRATAARLRAAAVRRGIAVPEVDVRQVWRRTLAEAARQGWLPAAAPRPDVERVAAAWELTTNPVRPRPGARSALQLFRSAGVLQGIVSNAQFEAPAMLAARFPCAGGSFWAPDLCVWSYAEGIAKPSPVLYAIAAERMHRRGVSPAETLMIGDHPVNDVAAAARAGFRTAWLCPADPPGQPDPPPDLRLQSLCGLRRALWRAGVRLCAGRGGPQ